MGCLPCRCNTGICTWQIDASKIEAKNTKNTKAIIGVHLYGQPFDINVVKAIADKHKLFLVEDAAQAQGALYNNKPVGGFAEMACFSFYPGKNLGACGEAGGITTNNEAYTKHLRSLRNHGCMVRYYHDEIAYNMRMGGLEGASLSVKLKYLSEWNNKRRDIAKQYQAKIQNKKVTMQAQPAWANSIYHLFVVTVEDRDKFVNYLEKNEIIAAFHYPVPCHLQKAYAHLGYKEGDYPNAEYLAKHCVSLPMFAELTDEEIAKVIDVVNAY
jgi:dTDP-4-amino-4,6-dideoxygalactose transaminase